MSGSFDSFAEGARGEDAASYFLRRYFDIGCLKPDPGIDFLGYYRRSKVRQPIAFQVKKANRFLFRSQILANWLASIHLQPVILFRTIEVSPRITRYQFKVLHEWMIEHPDCVSRLPEQKYVSIASDEFIDIDENAKNFLDAVTAEISRVQGHGLSPWAVRKWRGLPISEYEVFSHFGRLDRLELDASTLAAMTESFPGNSQESQWSAFREACNGQFGTEPYFVVDWRRRIAAGVLPSWVRVDIKAFEDFRKAMRSFLSGAGFDLPTTTWRNISPWRTFCQLYPKSLDMLGAYLANERRWADAMWSVGTAFNLITTMANTEDLVMMERARTIMAGVRDIFSVSRVNSYQQYCVVANYFAACCEVALKPDANLCMDFHRRHDEEWQIRWQRAYYQGTDVNSASAAFRKLKWPNLRNLATRDLDEWRLKLLLRRGVRLHADEVQSS